MTSNLCAISLKLCRASSLALLTCGMVSFSASSFASYEATAYIPNGNVIGHMTTPGDVSYTYNNAHGASAVAFSASPIASVSYATTAFNPSGQAGLSGGGIMTYSFEVDAQPFTSVPIDFSGLYSSSSSPASAGYGSFTRFLVQSVNSSTFAYSTFESFFRGDCGAPACLQYTTFNNTSYTSTQSDASHVEGSFQGTLDMLTGADGAVTGMVQLFAGAGVNTFFVPASATAFIDPHLEIDAAFLANNPGAKLTITPGVGNAIPAGPESNTVPEPSTYVLIMAGLAAVTIVGAFRPLKEPSQHSFRHPAGSFSDRTVRPLSGAGHRISVTPLAFLRGVQTDDNPYRPY